MNGTTICAVRIAAAHDGAAELIVTLRHGNGGESEVTLDETGAAALFDATGASTPEQLIGAPWQHVQAALAVSWNRFSNTTVDTARRNGHQAAAPLPSMDSGG